MLKANMQLFLTLPIINGFTTGSILEQVSQAFFIGYWKRKLNYPTKPLRHPARLTPLVLSLEKWTLFSPR